ncbi:hypothetical protein niasHS_013936 [Heterodera schachtii]|uniref:Uncharacterized protein n=1 Tax=Heterodera schachtii TaxID=97005 RepID=A0ABD2IHN1_HETSC
MSSHSSSGSSSGGSLKPNTLANSGGWRNDRFCHHIYEHHTAIKIRITSHDMLPVAPALTPKHHCAVVTFLCRMCAKRTHVTYEFSKEGEAETLGEYGNFIDVIRTRDISMSHQTLHDVFADMPKKDYCLMWYNCQNWAGNFFNNVLQKRMVDAYLCPCPNSNKTLLKIEVNKVKKTETRHVITAEVKCPCRGAPTFFTYELTAAGKRKNSGKCYQERSTYSMAKRQISLVKIEEIYEQMNNVYHVVNQNEKKWAMEFFDKVWHIPIDNAQ